MTGRGLVRRTCSKEWPLNRNLNDEKRANNRRMWESPLAEESVSAKALR
jgi:hypothetical protein